MIIDKYTKHSIFSLPLIIDPDLFNKHDLKTNGFNNMYVGNINACLLTNHFFLVFHSSMVSTEFENRLKEYHLYHNTTIVVKNNIQYTVYTFTRTYAINCIIRDTNYGNYQFLGYNSKLKILKFWEANISSKLHNYLFNSNIKTEPPISENIGKSEQLQIRNNYKMKKPRWSNQQGFLISNT